MKLSEKQAIVLLDIAKWSLNFGYPDHGYHRDFVVDVLNEIYNQQSDEPVELDKEKEP